MASPPPNPALSPPYPTSLALPRKRPSLALQNESSKRRKPSSASVSTVTSTHPLRQTSFPPEGLPGSRAYDRSPSVDSVSQAGGSVFSATTPGGANSVKRGRGRPKKNAAEGESVKGSAKGSAAGKALSGAASAKAGAGDDEWGEEEDGDDDVDAALEGLQDEAAKRQEREHMNILISAFDAEQLRLYETFRRVRLRKETVRRITNQTLSQSVPASVVTTINGFTKIFIGELIERARDVQTEWLAVSPTLPNGDPNPWWQAKYHPERKTATQTNGEVKVENGVNGDHPSPQQGEKAGLVEWDPVRERDRGPLTPDHMREALRRYKKDSEGGGAGLQGMSLEGPEKTAVRMKGRRLFK